jgi:hypothetical protein
MEYQEKNITAGSVSQHSSVTMSNAFLAAQVPDLLPKARREQIDTFESMSEWELATILEAIVAVAYESNPDVVEDLARYLARISTPKSLDEDDPKGRVIHLGGTIQSRREGGKDHKPVFLSKAFLHDKCATARGESKKQAERIASTKLLRLLELRKTGKRPFITIPMTHNQWVPFDQLMSFSPREDESFHAWWLRGAFEPRSAFQRAMASPLIFKDLLAVDSWTQRQEGEKTTETSSVMMVITSTKNSVSIPIQTAKSVTTARKEISLLANKYISNNFQALH